MKRGYLKVLIFTLIFSINCFFIYLSAYQSSDADISIEISSVPRVFIYSPENISYSFGSATSYHIPLNVSHLGFTPDIWWYNLRNQTDLINNSIVFIPSLYPNITVVGGYNKIEVYANDSSGNNYSDEVIFNVITYSAPVIQGINSSIYVCENESLDYAFWVLNNDSGSLEFIIQPMKPFYISPMVYTGGETLVNANIVSGILNKSYVRTFENPYLETISVDDGVYSDSVETNIYVIELNNPSDVENIGVKTFWSQGENSIFYEVVSVNDIEDGTESSGNFTFNLTWLDRENFFDISSLGIMNFSFNNSHLGIHNLSLCVKDLGIDYIHPNISLCSQNGDSIEKCQNFSITVTDLNRAPYITDYYPENLSFETQEGIATYLNITSYDPDYTIPDVYWYIDNVLVEYDSGNSVEELFYIFGYDAAGEHIINATITDGLLNDTMFWNVSVLDRAPSLPTISSGGGGGGGATSECIPLWVCGLWNTCNQIDVGIDKGEISKYDAKTIKDLCVANYLKPDKCGFQIRDCVDLNNCNIITGKPYETRMCKYFENPDCHDNITNCHHGSCEVLVDCGGPCIACPTCSDEMQNQGEEGIDCGGPCPWKCIEEKPSFKKINIIHLILILLLILIIIIIIKIIKILRYKRKFKEYEDKI